MTKWNRIIPLVMSLSAILTACGVGEGASPTPFSSPAAYSPAVAEPPSAAPAELFLPAAPGELAEERGKAAVDYSNTADGYVMARWSAPSEKKLKVRVTGAASEYTYDLAPEEWTAFPLSDGSGRYRVSVFENLEADSYTAVLTVDFDAALSSPFAPFLRPNQYVDYTNAPKTVEKAKQLAQGSAGAGEKIERIYAFVTDSLRYDEERAENVQSGYLPALDAVLEEEKGICWDYAALLAAMLRAQAIPCKLVVGQAGGSYHAWVSVWDGTDWMRMDPTFAASGKDLSGVSYTEQNVF